MSGLGEEFDSAMDAQADNVMQDLTTYYARIPRSSSEVSQESQTVQQKIDAILNERMFDPRPATIRNADGDLIPNPARAEEDQKAAAEIEKLLNPPAVSQPSLHDELVRVQSSIARTRQLQHITVSNVTTASELEAVQAEFTRKLWGLSRQRQQLFDRLRQQRQLPPPINDRMQHQRPMPPPQSSDVPLSSLMRPQPVVTPVRVNVERPCLTCLELGWSAYGCQNEAHLQVEPHAEPPAFPSWAFLPSRSSSSSASSSSSSSSSSSASSTSPTRCYKCNHPGHTAETCKVKADVIEVKEDQPVPAEACVICLENRKTHIITPCGHLCACQECVTKVEKCPVCRDPIKDRVRVYDT